MEPIKIFDIPPIDLRNQKMDKGGELRLLIYPGFIRYSCKFYADEPIDVNDHELGWEVVSSDMEIVADKTAITGFEKAYSQKDEHWSVLISISGMSYDIKVFYKSEKNAEELFQYLINYIYD